MARYSVPMTTWASTVVDVDVPDDITDPEQIAELALQQMAEEGGPSLCHQCASGRRGSGGLELGDEWGAVQHDGKPEVTRLD